MSAPVVHACPSDVTPCCGLALSELPPTDRVSGDPRTVTCVMSADDALVEVLAQGLREIDRLRAKLDEHRAHYVDPAEHARVVAALARVAALAVKWDDDRAEYPPDGIGQFAAMVLRLSTDELRAALDGEETIKHRDMPGCVVTGCPHTMAACRTHCPSCGGNVDTDPPCQRNLITGEGSHSWSDGLPYATEATS